MPPIGGPLKRIERAKFHLDDLNSQFGVFMDSDPYPISREPDTKKGGYLYRIGVRSEPPASLGLIFGDFVHNLRASLDNLIYEIAFQNRRRLSFPVYSNGAKFAIEFAPLLRSSVSSQDFDLIEGLQPYHARDSWDDRLKLRVLNSFWNKDKHRTTTPIVTASYMAASIGGDPSNFRLYHGDIYDGKPIAWVGPTHPYPDRQPQLPVHIRFRRRPIVLIESLPEYHRYVEGILRAFENA